MILKIFSMRDEKAEAFVRPFFMPTLALAIRAVTTAGQEDTHPFALHPKDYILYELGTWDEEHADFDLSVAPQRHGSVYDLTPVDERSGHETAVLKPNLAGAEQSHG